MLKPFNKQELLQALSSCVKAIDLEQKAQEYTDAEEMDKDLFIDPVTQLPNYNKLEKDVQSFHNPTLIMFELFGFEQIDSMYGTDVANKLLKQIAGFYTVQVPQGQKLYRYQYNQFAILLEDFDLIAVKDLITTFDNVTLLSSFETYGINIYFKLQYGICREKENIVEKAFMALQEAHNIPNKNYCFYDSKSDMIKQQQKNILCGMKLKNALEKENIIAYYQPILNLKNNQIEKYEALARMKDNGQMVAPMDFIPAGKTMGLHVPMTKQMINQSFKKFADTRMQIALNLSLEDFIDSDIPFFLEKRVLDFGIDPAQVVLEITEDISIDPNSDVLYTLQKFKQKGFRLAIDDFGTKMANFSNICSIEPDFVKIDGQFIKDLEFNDKNYTIVKSIVTVAKSIGAQTIAEFVHNEKILQIVKDLDVDFAQGYLIGVPSNKNEGDSNG